MNLVPLVSCNLKCNHGFFVKVIPKSRSHMSWDIPSPPWWHFPNPRHSHLASKPQRGWRNSKISQWLWRLCHPIWWRNECIKCPRMSQRWKKNDYQFGYDKDEQNTLDRLWKHDYVCWSWDYWLGFGNTSNSLYPKLESVENMELAEFFKHFEIIKACLHLYDFSCQ